MKDCYTNVALSDSGRDDIEFLIFYFILYYIILYYIILYYIYIE
jgi:hypothetical protein